MKNLTIIVGTFESCMSYTLSVKHSIISGVFSSKKIIKLYNDCIIKI